MAEPLPPFADMLSGKACPFCQPRPDSNEFWQKIGSLQVSTLYLERNQTYRGYAILVFDARHVTGLEHLTGDEYALYTKDLHVAARAVFEAVSPDHMNYSTLGNVIPHLHYHIIPRYKSDPRWGSPVWTSKLEDMMNISLPEEEYQALIIRIRDNL